LGENSSPTDFATSSIYGSGVSRPPGATQPAQFQYDGLGRVTRATDFLGQASTTSYQFGSTISVTTQDPEQLNPSSSQFGSFTTKSYDGHGRAIGSDAHLASTVNGTVDVTTSAGYLATGEVQSFSQSNPGGLPYSRSMAYDTLGRLVSNTEPNSGTWTYAYNDAGEVVGTSDARGCGMNIYRDTLGRVTAEDYSPCTSSQPPYTAANPATGSGAEAFFVYDAYGRIAKNYDRAQFSTYLYDGRGRLEEIDRRVAPPGNIPTFSSGASGSDTSTVSISGVATDGAGNPLPGLTVTLSGSTAPATMQTGANGQYSFAGLTDGRNYSVNASTSISGCSLTPTTVANFNPLSTSATVDFQGQGGACGTPTSTPIVQFGNLSIRGVVAASDGTGIPGIRITLSGNLQGTGQAVTHTDNSGFYAFDGLGTGSFSLNVGAAPSGCTVSPVLTTQLNFNNIKSSIVENFTATSGCEPGGGAGQQLRTARLRQDVRL
jgi:YD repeat-containing protein